MSKVKVGDKVKVVRIAESFEGYGYKVGDVFEVAEVETDNRIHAPEEGAILTTLTGIELYEKEVELYDEDAEHAAKDADVSTWVKEEQVDEYNEIVIGLSQAIAMKAEQMRGENVDMPKMDNHWINEVNLDEEDSVWDAAPEVGKEIIYDDYNPDSVEHPSHYTQGSVEVIDIIAQTVSGYDDGFTAHCVGTATKYLNRAPHKHETPLEDLKKAAKYLEFAIKHEEKKRI